MRIIAETQDEKAKRGRQERAGGPAGERVGHLDPPKQPGAQEQDRQREEQQPGIRAEHRADPSPGEGGDQRIGKGGRDDPGYDRAIAVIARCQGENEQLALVADFAEQAAEKGEQQGVHQRPAFRRAEG
ncbi:hypothetical protein BF95_08615 [Sphingobium sp. Ant17]|nr:hypothetical protein BF95_08615 [Sphingobium sp. Ant17]